MNANIMLKEDITPVGSDYETVRQVIEILTVEYRDQPSLETIAAKLSQSPTQLQKTFTRWAGLSPKAFLQAVTLDHAKRLLHNEELPLLETSLEVGLSGPSRLHDLFVTHEAMSPGEWKAVKAWHDKIGARPAVQAGFRVGTELQKPGAVPMTVEQKRAMFARRF